MARFCVRPIAGSTLAAVLAMAMASGPAAAAGAPPDISGTYWATEYRAKIALVGGGELPLTPAGRAAYEINMAGFEDKTLVDGARKFCTPDGIPRVLATPHPFEIVQSPPGQVLMMHELNHQIRTIPLNQALPPMRELIPAPWFNGHSVGRWEGDTLVVQTAGFNDRTFLDATGAPHTDQLLTTERWRKTSPTELEVVVTIHDPEYYSRDWQARFTYTLRPDVRIEDYVCGEEHRDLSSVRGVRRP